MATIFFQERPLGLPTPMGSGSEGPIERQFRRASDSMLFDARAEVTLSQGQSQLLMIADLGVRNSHSRDVFFATPALVLLRWGRASDRDFQVWPTIAFGSKVCLLADM